MLLLAPQVRRECVSLLVLWWPGTSNLVLRSVSRSL